MNGLTNGTPTIFHQPAMDERELVTAKHLAPLLDVSVRTIWDWVKAAKNNHSGDGIPFVNVPPGSRNLRFPIKKVRLWYERGRTQ